MVLGGPYFLGRGGGGGGGRVFCRRRSGGTDLGGTNYRMATLLAYVICGVVSNKSLFEDVGRQSRL